MKKLASFFVLLALALPCYADSTDKSIEYILNRAFNGTDALNVSGGAAGDVTVGDGIASGTANRVLYEDSSNNLAEDVNLQFDGTTFLADTVDLNGGAIDGTRIGFTSAADATFTAINSTSFSGTTATFTVVSGTASVIGGAITGTSLNNAKIGNSSAADATFTSIAIGSNVLQSFPVNTSLGGTGSAAGFALYSPIYAGTTSTGAFQSGTLGSAGHVLTSNGATSLPTFKAAPAASLAIGGSISSGAANRVLYENSSNQLAESSGFVFDGSTLTVGTNATISSVGTVSSGGLNLQQRIIQFTVSSTAATPTTTVGQNCAGDNGWSVPVELNGFKVVTVAANVTTASSVGVFTANIKNRTTGNNILSTALTIDANELSTSTAATPPVINQSTNTLTTDDDVCVQVSVAPNGSYGARAKMVVQK